MCYQLLLQVTTVDVSYQAHVGYDAIAIILCGLIQSGYFILLFYILNYIHSKFILNKTRLK